MYRILSLVFLAGIIQASCPEILDSDVKILNKKEYKNLCEFSGKTILVVNTASKCGFTYQYEQLEDMYSCLLYTSPSPRDTRRSRMPSSA